MRCSLVCFVLVFLISCVDHGVTTNGEYWAEEVCKMQDNPSYDSPVTKEYMKMKFYTDNCDSDFFEGFKNYANKDSLHKQHLMKQLELMRKGCE